MPGFKSTYIIRIHENFQKKGELPSVLYSTCKYECRIVTQGRICLLVLNCLGCYLKFTYMYLNVYTVYSTLDHVCVNLTNVCVTNVGLANTTSGNNLCC